MSKLIVPCAREPALGIAPELRRGAETGASRRDKPLAGGKSKFLTLVRCQLGGCLKFPPGKPAESSKAIVPLPE